MPWISRRAAGALPLFAVGLAALPAAASADAPARFYAYDPGGSEVAYARAVAVAPDASEVLFTRYDGLTYLRNVATSTTTTPLPAGSEALAASTDLKRILFRTVDKLDPADTDGASDVYVLDRPSGKTILASRTSATGPATGTTNWAPDASISGDGTVVIFDADADDRHSVKYNLATGVVSPVGPGGMIDHEGIGKTGNVAITTKGVVSGTKTFPLPSDFVYGDYGGREGEARTASGGSAVAFKTTATGLTVLNTTSGARKTVAVPSWLSATPYTVLAVTNGGTFVAVSTVLQRTGGKKQVVGLINVATGVVGQLGPDTAYSDSAPTGQFISDDGSFFATGNQISALGTKTIPGTGPAAPTANPIDFVTFYPGCSNGGLFAGPVQPSLVLNAGPIGSAPQKAVKADIVVRINKTGVVANQFSLVPNQRKNLTAGFGGFTITAKVSYADGTSATGSRVVNPYTPVKHDEWIDDPGLSVCRNLNGLV